MGLFSKIAKFATGGLLGGGVASKVEHNNNKAVAQKNAVNDARFFDRATQDETKIRSLFAQQPTRRSILDTNEAKGLQSEAYGTNPLAEYEAMRGQARSAAAAGATRLGDQLNDELSDQAISGAGARDNAYSALAMGGGLSSGARERVASGGLQSQMMGAQAARMANKRALFDNQQKLDEGLLGLSGQEATTRRGMQNQYLGMQGNDIAQGNQFNQDQFNKNLDMESGFLKSRGEYDIARMNRK
jgi:hypothetical protein